MARSPLNLSAISVLRPVAMCAFIIMLVLLGISSYSRIGIDILPKFDVPYVQITAVYPGASPEEVETEVARRIEDAVSSLDGLKHITTICMDNGGAITLEFELGRNVDMLVHDVREKINRIVSDLPESVETPTLGKLNVNAVPVATLFLTGSRPLDELYDYAEDHLADSFSSIPGVGEVRLHGGNKLQMHITPDRKKLAESGLTIPELIAKLKKNHLKLPVGRLQRSHSEITLTYDAEFKTPEELRRLEVTRINGKRIHLGDIAEVKLHAKEIRQRAFLDGREGVMLDIVKKADANSVKVIAAVRQRYEMLRSTPGMLPGGTELHWFKDTGKFIKASVDDAWMSVIMGILLTAVTLYFFLHKLKPTLIITVTLPVSFVIAFLFMRAFHFTFDMMTLVSLGCASGVLVDNSVVVLESIFSRLSSGDEPKDASVDGTSSVANAVLASALTNIVVFVPIAMMSSVAGLIIGPFAGVMVLVTLISIFITFTLTAILASRMLRKGGQEKPNLFARLWDRGYEAAKQGFLRSLEGVRDHAFAVVFCILLLCAGLMAWTIPGLSSTFIPTSDRGEMTLNLEFPADSSLAENTRRAAEIAADIRKLPFVEAVGSTVGYRNATTGQLAEGIYLAGLTIKLIPREQRESVEMLLDTVRRTVQKYDNLRFNLAVPVLSGTSGAELTAYVTGPDPELLDHYAEMGCEILRKSGLAADLDNTVRPKKPRIILRPERAILRNMGLDAETIGTAAVGFFDGIECGTYKVNGRSFDIRIRSSEEQGVESIRRLIVGSVNNLPLNLESVVTLIPDPVPLSIRRQDKERCSWIYANPVKGASLGKLVNCLKQELEPQLPTGYRLAFFGQAEMLSDGIRDFRTAFFFAVVMTYLLIAAIMESWSKPFLILFTVPLGFVGLFVILELTRTPFSIVGMLGAIMMIGIVVNNAILIMDEVGTLTKQGMPPQDAMLRACDSKFRAIMMTSLTSIVGMLPMAFGTGLGSEIRSSCGIGVVGGLIFSTALTLYLIPALYFLFTKRHKEQI